MTEHSTSVTSRLDLIPRWPVDHPACEHTWVPSSGLCGHNGTMCKMRDLEVMRRGWVTHLSPKQLGEQVERCIS